MARKSSAGPRLSVEPLVGMLAANNIDVEFIEGRLNQSIRNAKFRGYFTLDTADEIACHILKMHPAEVWGEEYERIVWHDADEDIDVSVEADKRKDIRPELRDVKVPA